MRQDVEWADGRHVTADDVIFTFSAIMNPYTGARIPLSDGPYVLKEWINGDHMTFVKNDNYYEKGKPAIGTVTIRIVPDEAVRKTMLINGDADLDMWTTEPMIADLKDKPNVDVEPSPYNRWVMRLYFNLSAKGTNDPVATPHPILSDVDVRR